VIETLEARLRQLMESSDLIRTLSDARVDGGQKYALGGSPLRQLFKPEIAMMEEQGSTAEDWSRVRVAERFNARRVRNCEFRGNVILGEFKQRVRLAEGVEVISGLANSTIVDCVIGNDALIKDVRLLANYVVAEGAIVVDCGRVVCSASASFGNGTRAAVALEGGGREIELLAEMDVELASLVAKPLDRRTELEAYRKTVQEYRRLATSDRGVIGAGAQVWGVSRLESSFIGPAVEINGAEMICRSTLLSSIEEPVIVESGAMIVDSIVQWGARVAGMAIVERSLLIEQSSVEGHGKVRDSVVGSNSHLAAGEVVSCLLGPFVACPHQSLLISTYWPEGRGNVGYGANVGSNHTSRAPDQEFLAGEGLFIGLGANFKFPCDFSKAPYTVIACNTNLAPQKVAFPFSLIAPLLDYYPGVPKDFNQISPGWMLRENIYALKRNEAKFRARNRARRAQFDFAVIRRSTVEAMLDAVRRLSGVSSEQGFYTERQIPGLGHNVLTEKDRTRAIDAYRFYACFYALQGMKTRIAHQLATGKGDAGRLLQLASHSEEWEYQRGILVNEFGLNDTPAALSLLASMSFTIAKDCERARSKDENRGVKLIEDYAEVHPSADRDRIVRQAWEDADIVQREVDGFLRLLSKGVSQIKEEHYA
jgi:hypothetical protein